MHAFFRYYGSKHSIAKFYGPPRRDLVIEPFAGSASYSTYWNPKNVQLYDIDEHVCNLWDYLINCSEDDIKRLPDVIENCDHLHSYSPVETHLMARWIWFSHAKINSAPRNSDLKFYKESIASGSKTVWSNLTKQRIVQQKPLIASWTIDQLSYEKIPNVEAHYHVDPPYFNKYQGGAYKHDVRLLDYEQLAEWCVTRDGHVDVCEIDGATWLPFRYLRERNTSAGTKSVEVVWRTTFETEQGELLDVNNANELVLHSLFEVIQWARDNIECEVVGCWPERKQEFGTRFRIFYNA